ncbi:hypothetical protein JCM6882_002456 [Rhodosporidiobolus microsporus]
MRFTSLAAAVAFIGSALAQSAPTINTPTALYECQPYLVTWSGGSAPYYIRVLPGGQLSGQTLTTIGDFPTSATSSSWTVNIAAGTSITLTITDSTGVTAASAPVTVGQGDSSCIGQSSPASGASSSFSASSTVASSAVSSSASATSSSVASSASSVSSSVSSAASSASSSASSVASSVSSAASSAASGSVAPSASPTGAANSVKAGSAFALAAAGLVVALA